MGNKKYILSKETAEKKLRRMALEVAERNYGEQQLVLIGIKDSGLIVAHKICHYLKEVFTGITNPNNAFSLNTLRSA